MSPRVIHHRKVSCATCPQPCTGSIAGSLTLNDPAFGCPLLRFTPWYGPGDATAPPFAPFLIVASYDGSAKWKLLRDLAYKDQVTDVWLDQWQSDLPIFGCQCLPHWLADRQAHPLPATGQFAWYVDRHNTVNARLRASGLDRPHFPLSVALARCAPP